MKNALIVLGLTIVSASSAFAASSDFSDISAKVDRIHAQLTVGGTQSAQAREDALDLTYILIKASDGELNTYERQKLEEISFRNGL